RRRKVRHRGARWRAPLPVDWDSEISAVTRPCQLGAYHVRAERVEVDLAVGIVRIQFEKRKRVDGTIAGPAAEDGAGAEEHARTAGYRARGDGDLGEAAEGSGSITQCDERLGGTRVAFHHVRAPIAIDVDDVDFIACGQPQVQGFGGREPIQE